MTHAEFQSAAERLAPTCKVATQVEVSSRAGGNRRVEFSVFVHVGGECLMAAAASADEALVLMRGKLDSTRVGAADARLSLVGDVAKELAAA